MQGRPAHELDVEVALAEGALASLADRRERLGEDVVERLARSQALTKDVGLGTQLGVGELLEVLLDGVHLGGDAVELLDDAALTGTQQLLDDLGHAASPERSRPPCSNARCGRTPALVVHGAGTSVPTARPRLVESARRGG